MAGIRYKGQIFSGAASFGSANDVAYDNTTSGLTATNVQDALDESAIRRVSTTTIKDFNNFPVNSICHVAGSDYSNSPTGNGTAYGVCVTIAGSTNQWGYTVQTCYLLSSGEVYQISVRSFAEGSWHSWRHLAFS